MDPAHRLHPKVSVILHVCDNESDLVRMPGEHELFRIFHLLVGMAHGDEIAHRIGMQLVHIVLYQRGDSLALPFLLCRKRPGSA